MITLTLYEPSGRIIGYVTRNDIKGIDSGVLYVTGMVPGDHYIKNGQAQPLPPNPTNEDQIYDFDYQRHEWVIDLAMTNTRVRQNRDGRLAQLDQVNPVRYAGLTDQQRQELQIYRQALLDVPQQPGFPQQLTWPAKPTWL